MLDENVCRREVDNEIALGKHRFLEDLYLFYVFSQLPLHLVVLKQTVLVLSAVPTPQLLVPNLNLLLVFSGLAELLLETLGVVKRRTNDGRDILALRFLTLIKFYLLVL